MLTEVCGMFEAVHGREPTVWIDKFCIDQLNIDESLLYLPVFASASRSVLVAVGSSYFSRLWCVWEMFVLSHCTDNFSNVVFWPLSGCDTSQLGGFSAKDVGCFKAEDKGKILSVIDSLNGGISQFEQVVRQDVLTAVHEAAGRFEPTGGDSTSRRPSLTAEGSEDVRRRMHRMERTSMSKLPLADAASHPEGQPPTSSTIWRLGQRYGVGDLV